jgi:hypothetical protein
MQLDAFLRRVAGNPRLKKKCARYAIRLILHEFRSIIGKVRTLNARTGDPDETHYPLRRADGRCLAVYQRSHFCAG